MRDNMKKNKKLVSLVLMALVLLSAFSILSASAVSYGNNISLEEQVKSVFFDRYQHIPEEYWGCYEEIYRFSDPDDMTLEYLLLHTCAVEGDKVTVEIIGDYVVASERRSFPYELGYFVYVPSENSIYTLREAVDADVEGIEKVFTGYKVKTALIGDADSDATLTVKDATFIQKVEAGYEMNADNDDYLYWYMEEIIHDFNRDGVVNIRDATAIQKQVAGIEVDYPDNSNEYENIPFSDRVSEDADFEENCIIVATKYGWGHDYTLEDFPEYEFSSIKKIGGTDGKGYAIYALYLKNPSRENVFEAIRSLDYRAGTDLESAEPNYIWYID